MAPFNRSHTSSTVMWQCGSERCCALSSP